MFFFVKVGWTVIRIEDGAKGTITGFFESKDGKLNEYVTTAGACDQDKPFYGVVPLYRIHWQGPDDDDIDLVDRSEFVRFQILD